MFIIYTNHMAKIEFQLEASHLKVHLGLPELPGRELCEHSNLPDDRRWCDLPGGLLGLLWRLEGEQVPDLHLRFLPRCYPRRSGTTSSHPFKNRTNLFRPFEH